MTFTMSRSTIFTDWSLFYKLGACLRQTTDHQRGEVQQRGGVLGYTKDGGWWSYKQQSSDMFVKDIEDPYSSTPGSKLTLIYTIN